MFIYLFFYLLFLSVKTYVCLDSYDYCWWWGWWWFTLWSVLTSVPYLARAALACWRIFSLYIWAARLLYLALVSLVEQPCWRKKAVFEAEGDNMLFIHSTASTRLKLQHKISPQGKELLYWSLQAKLFSLFVCFGGEVNSNSQHWRCLQPAYIWAETSSSWSPTQWIYRRVTNIVINSSRSSLLHKVLTPRLQFLCCYWGATAHLMKLRCTPSERWMPEQSMHRNTP